MGDPLAVTQTLLQLAHKRLQPHGRLVFWLPTAAHATETEVRGLLAELALRAGAGSLVYVRSTPEELNGSLWRWLCVFEKVGGGEN
jgi:hypothetical protein